MHSYTRPLPSLAVVGLCGCLWGGRPTTQVKLLSLMLLVWLNTSRAKTNNGIKLNHLAEWFAPVVLRFGQVLPFRIHVAGKRNQVDAQEEPVVLQQNHLIGEYIPVVGKYIPVDGKPIAVDGKPVTVDALRIHWNGQSMQTLKLQNSSNYQLI